LSAWRVLRALACCALAAAPVPAAAAPAELDRVVDAAGLRLHLHCEGSGSPAVIFDSGSGNDGSVWRAVQPGVARSTRACAYDRAGLGYSGPGRKPRNSDRMAMELHALLEAAQVPPPYVLVGHSAGGLNVRLFASDNPGEVVGMVLVDATTEHVGDRLWSLLSTEEVAEQRERMRRGPDGWDHDSFIASMKQVAATPALGALPLVVLTAGRDNSPAPGVTPEQAARRFEVWQQLQAELPRLSSNSRHLVMPDARHFIQWDAPATVVRAVEDVVSAARTGQRLAGAAPAAPAHNPSASGNAASDAGSAAEPPALEDAPAPATSPPMLPATSPPMLPATSPPALAAAPGDAGATTLWQRFRQGGAIMFALVGLSILALATLLDLGLGLLRKRGQDRTLFEQTQALWSEGRFAEIEELCRSNDGIAARIVLTVVRHRNESYADVNALAGETASGALREQLRRNDGLSIVATLSPLLGLFGTVVGMVEAFDAIAASGERGDRALVAAGISKALVTTVGGLLVGIPALAARHFFQARIHRLAAELERQTNDLLRRWLLGRGEP
jgi:biopolymer transport protein ExbB/TolQ/pimeloyl-ACP methyl ester carboxylesterase